MRCVSPREIFYSFLATQVIYSDSSALDLLLFCTETWVVASLSKVLAVKYTYKQAHITTHVIIPNWGYYYA